MSDEKKWKEFDAAEFCLDRGIQKVYLAEFSQIADEAYTAGQMQERGRVKELETMLRDRLGYHYTDECDDFQYEKDGVWGCNQNHFIRRIEGKPNEC